MMPRLFTADVPPSAARERQALTASMMPRLFTADVAQQFRRQVIHLLASMMPRLFTADVPSSCGVWGAMERLQ